MDKVIKETVKGNWKIVSIAKDDETIIENQITNIDIIQDRLIHIPTNKIVMAARSYEQLTSVGSYEYSETLYFSDEENYVIKSYSKYKLSELLEKPYHSAYFAK